MEPKLGMLMQQLSREFNVRRATVVKQAAALVIFGAAVLLVFWPPRVAAQFGLVPMEIITFVSVIVIGIGMILLGFIWHEIGKCRSVWWEFHLFFWFDAPLTPESREGTEAGVREILCRMAADLKARFAEQEALASDLKAGNYEAHLDLRPAGPDGTPMPLSGIHILSLMDAKLVAFTSEIDERKKEFHRAVDTATSGWLVFPYPYWKFTHRYEDYQPIPEAAGAE